MKRRAFGSPASVDVPAPQPVRLESGLRTRVSLTVGAEGLWFKLPAGPVVSVERWRPLQRLLTRLAEERQLRPGQPLPVDTLVLAGWPGERMLARAGATRVYTAIASLRRLGLRDVLLSVEHGYLLAPGVPLELGSHATEGG